MKALSHPDYDSYDGPLPLELAKQWDLRTLSTYLAGLMPQAAIDLLYPLPTEELGGADDSEDSASDSESE